jgi:hypothetical protein
MDHEKQKLGESLRRLTAERDRLIKQKAASPLQIVGKIAKLNEQIEEVRRKIFPK